MLKGSGTSSPFMTCFIVFRVFLEWKKLVDRGTRMIVDSLGIPYDQAQQLLLLHGSVAEVMKKFPKEE